MPISVKYITNKLLNDLNKKFFLHLGPPKILGSKKIKLLKKNCMRNAFSRIGILFLSIIVLNACKSDDDSGGYVPLDIVANADIAEVFQNASLEIYILNNDDNIRKEKLS